MAEELTDADIIETDLLDSEFEDIEEVSGVFQKASPPPLSRESKITACTVESNGDLTFNCTRDTSLHSLLKDDARINSVTSYDAATRNYKITVEAEDANDSVDYLLLHQNDRFNSKDELRILEGAKNSVMKPHEPDAPKDPKKGLSDLDMSFI